VGIRRLGLLIVVSDPFYLGLWGLALARVHRVPLVVRVNANYNTIHASTQVALYPLLLRRVRLERLIARAVFARADLVTVGSDDNLRYVMAAGAVAQRVAVVPTGDMIAAVHLTSPDDRETVGAELGLGDRPNRRLRRPPRALQAAGDRPARPDGAEAGASGGFAPHGRRRLMRAEVTRPDSTVPPCSAPRAIIHTTTRQVRIPR